MRLDPSFRWAVYGVLAVLFVSGAAWLAADALKDGPDADAWQIIAADLLMLHGGASMIVLLLIGALVPLHITRGWRSDRNRGSGSAMVTINGLLIVTAFALYYSGSDLLRAWSGYVHIGAGLVLPLLVLVHVGLGRRSRST